MSEDFLSNDLKSVNISQPTNAVKTNTFTLKFNELSNTQLDILSEAIHNELYKNSVSQKPLPPQSIQSILTTSLIPTDFMGLLESEHAYQYLNDQNDPFEKQNICKILQLNLQDKLYITEQITKRVAHGIDLKGYVHIFNPQCFKNAFGETLVDFFDFNNPVAVKETQMGVNQYYNHTYTNPSHQSKNFTKDLVEHFGSFTDSNIEPFTSANTTSSHCQEHLECVQKLIKGLQPILNVINNYFNNTYPCLYAKMKTLDLGPNVSKPFGAFPTVSINFNAICQFHHDLKDHRNTLCVVCPLGTFKGGKLIFPELRLVIYVKQGYGVAF
ncbi:12362_t:CDS:2 [Funneliformis geosporum]|uniref:12362_t:CDS:1 n=1 Tax=Funneliformis geosporum TaxID=1117311 RepID=A0A9W4X1P3_9GLOM|nr:12362_t:CDS:2 [Funneliformis geosporum]